MAKRYVTVTVEGFTLDAVEAALSEIVGPALNQVRITHFVGIHIDVSDVSEAVVYGSQYETAEDKSSDPGAKVVVDVDLYAGRESPVRQLQLALAAVIADQLSATLGTLARISES